MNDQETVRTAQPRRPAMRPDAARFMRPDAHRYIRPDAARFLIPGTMSADVFPVFDYKYSPTQRRIPAGKPGGGRWTDGTEDNDGTGGVSPVGGGTSVGEGGEIDAIDATGPDISDPVMAFGEPGTSDLWTDLIGDDLTLPRPIPNAEPDDVPENLEEVNARRGASINSNFPGASYRQLIQLDQAVARSENAQTEIRLYDPDWKPSEASLRAPGSIEGAINSAEARAAEAESRLQQLRTGIGGNFGPPLQRPPTSGTLSSRVFDGGAWIDTYRAINNAPDLFGQPTWALDSGTVAVSDVDGTKYFGVNSSAPGYTSIDREAANTLRWNLITKYPDDLRTDNIGMAPNDAVYHAEANILLRAARDGQGSLEDKSLEVMVDRQMCDSCSKILPKIGMELGNPYVVYVERQSGLRSVMWNGDWLTWRQK